MRASSSWQSGHGPCPGNACDAGNNDMQPQRTRIKICGLTCINDAIEAIRLGADALGFIFVEESPRHVKPEAVACITAQLPPFVSRVGVFKDHDPEWIRKIVHLCRLHIVQLHGEESPEYCHDLGLDYIKAFRIKDEGSLETLQYYSNTANKRTFLLDTFVPDKAGGTGKTFDWHLARMATAFGPIILSGGIHPGNVGQAIAQVRPFAIDTCSGVEIAPGKKDIKKLEALVDQVNKADRIIYKGKE